MVYAYRTELHDRSVFLDKEIQTQKLEIKKFDITMHRPSYTYRMYLCSEPWSPPATPQPLS